MKQIDVYSRQGCHLCEVLIESLNELVRSRAELVVHDVDTREDWRESYGLRVPLVQYRGRTISEFSLDRDAVLSVLADRA